MNRKKKNLLLAAILGCVALFLYLLAIWHVVGGVSAS